MTSEIVASIIGLAAAGGFALWFVVPAVRREPDRAGWLLLVSIASIILMSSIRALGSELPEDDALPQAVHRLANEALVLGALAMYEFGAAFAGSRRYLDWVARIASLGVAILVAVSVNNVAGTSRTPAQDVLAACFLSVWTVLIGAAAVRIWLVRRAHASPVIRGRLRMLAFSIALLAVGIWPAIVTPTSTGVLVARMTITVSLMAVAVAFGPPRALRAAWQSRSIREAQLATVAAVEAEDEATAIEAILPVIAMLMSSTRVELRDATGAITYAHGVDSQSPTTTTWMSHDEHLPLATTGGEIRSIGSMHAPLMGAGEDVSAKVLANTLDLALDRIRRLERERRRAKRIAEADRMKDTFLAAVSHDLRNPLTAMIGFAHILQEPEDAPPLDPPTRRLAASELLVASERLDRMLDGLLDLSRIQHGHMELDRIPCDVLAVVRAGAERAILQSSTVHVAAIL